MTPLNRVNVYLYILILSMIYIIYIPWLIYASYKYLKQQQNILIQSRYPTITKTQLIFTFLLIAIIYPMNLTYRIIIENSVSDSHSLNLLYNITLCLERITVYTAIYALLWRIYLNFYDINLQQETTSKLWKLQINSCYIHDNNNWFETNKNKYGSMKSTFKYVFLCYIISIIVSYFSWLNFSIHISYTIDFFIFLIQFVWLLYLRFHMSIFFDELFIIEEIKLIIRIIIICMIIYLISISSFMHLFHDYIIPICYLNVATIITIVCVINTQWIVYKINNLENKQPAKYIKINEILN
eukprot:311751_1